jgi:hypothetical protein
MKPARTLAALGLILIAFALSACDTCGDPVRAQNGDTMTACKGDGPGIR